MCQSPSDFPMSSTCHRRHRWPKLQHCRVRRPSRPVAVETKHTGAQEYERHRAVGMYYVR